MALALPWDYAAGVAGVCAAGGLVLPRTAWRGSPAVGAFLREAAIVIGLYGLWQLAGRMSVTGTGGAFARAAWIEGAQRTIGLPSEAAMQHLVLWSPFLVQIANIYYAVIHFPATIALLIWLFVRHRADYGRARTVLAVTTFLCLMIQLMPVAPPRMMPGIVDTGIKYGQSVYGTGLGADELSAMPSVHVAWAAAVGWYMWRIAPRRWRWVGPAHLAVTVFVVVVTGNHWWLDGVVAVLVLAAAGFAVEAAYRAVGHLRVARAAVPAVAAAGSAEP